MFLDLALKTDRMLKKLDVANVNLIKDETA